MSWNILPKNVLQYFLEKIKSKFMLIWNHDILGAKNILPFPYTYGSGTNYGLTITVHEDGSITAQGTPTQTIMFLINDNIIENLSLWQGSEMIFSEWEVQNQNAFAALLLGQSTPISEVRGDYKLTVTSEMIQQGVAFILYFGNGVDLTTPITFKPMIRLATDPDHTWRSPALTNKQLTDSVFYLSYAKSHVSANPSTTTGVLNGLEIDGTAYEIQGTGEPNVQADWDEVDSTADDYIKNKPSLATVATSGSYNDLSNKPTIPDISTKVSKSGDTMTGPLLVNATGGVGSYDEGIRINAGKNGYSTLVIGGTADSTSGTTDGQFWIGTNPTNASYKRKLYIAHAGSTASGTYFESDSASRVGPALHLGWSGSVSSGNAYAVTGGNVYDAIAAALFKVTRGSSVDLGTTGYWAAMCNSGGPSNKWWHIISMDWSGNDNKNWISQLAIATQDGNGVWWRRNNAGGTAITSSTWHRLAEGDANGSASSCNGYTLGKSVPSNAVFTDTNNATQQTNCGTNNWNLRALLSGSQDDTQRTEGVYKSQDLQYNPYWKALYIGSNNRTWGMIYAQGNQQLNISASAEENYRLFLGVRESTWSLAPLYNQYLKLGTGSFKWNQIYSSSATINTSDRRKKKDIQPLDENARIFVMKLNPVSYKLKDGETGRTHYGMIAQDIEDELTELGMTAMDFAGFCKDEVYENVKTTREGFTEVKTVKKPGEYIYGLRYEEFIAPLIKTVQLQQQEIEGLKHRIDILEGK